jgi:hypothetical protein
MFAKVNTLGWALFEELTSAQMNQLDLNVSRSLDGFNGGEYTLSAPLIIHGTVSIDTISGGISYTGPLVSSFSFASHGFSTVIDTNTCVIDSATFSITCETTVTADGSMTFASGSEVVFAAGSDVDFNSTPAFNAGFSVGAGAVTFDVTPTFNDGMVISTSDEILYAGGGRGWVVVVPFMMGDQYNSYYERSFDGRYVKQIDNGTVARWFSWAQGLWGANAVTIENAECRTRANGGLSGTPTDDTEFTLVVASRDNDSETTRTLVDPTPNSATVHSAFLSPFGSAIAYDPKTQVVGMIAEGYKGGDTLDNASKWYEILSWRLTLRTTAKGVY